MSTIYGPHVPFRSVQSLPTIVSPDVVALVEARMFEHNPATVDEEFMRLAESVQDQMPGKSFIEAAVAAAKDAPELYEAYRRNILKGRRNG